MSAQEACALAGAAEMSAGNTAIPDVRASAAAAAISGGFVSSLWSSF